MGRYQQHPAVILPSGGTPTLRRADIPAISVSPVVCVYRFCLSHYRFVPTMPSMGGPNTNVSEQRDISAQ